MKEEDFKKIEEYQKVFKKKFNSFRGRSPIFFSYQTDVHRVYIQIEDQLDILKFEINYNEDVTYFIHDIHLFLRENYYPRIRKIQRVLVDPLIELINKRMEKYSETLEEAFKKLSVSFEETVYIIDKLDKIKNKVVLLKEGEEEFPLVYKMKIPVIVFLNKIKENSENENYKFFEKNSVFVENTKKGGEN
jgi:hypothetical protein